MLKKMIRSIGKFKKEMEIQRTERRVVRQSIQRGMNL